MTNYDRAQLAATRLLIHQHICGLMTTPQWLEFDRPILFESMQKYSESVGKRPSDIFGDDETGTLLEGTTIKKGITRIVLYDRHLSWGRRKFTLAHELGHIYLNHKENGPEQEQEANWFASQLLMPECVLMELRRWNGSLQVEDVKNWFMVSTTAAMTRISRIERTKSYRFGYEEQKLLKMYMPHIMEAINCPYFVSV